MKYFSTRNAKNSLYFKNAVIRGLADDGGLFVPESFPKFDLEKLENLDYKELAYEILSLYLSDFSKEDLEEIIEMAYDEKFPKNPAPLTDAGDLNFLELYHGPSLAFKDFALSILPKFIENARKSLEIKEKLLVLTATSGDTGSASLKGFPNLEGVDVAVFYPEEGISEIQKLQMTTNKADNDLVVAIKGNFDNAQAGVKEVFSDKEVLKKLEEKNVRFTSANSINIGRLLPQVVYYFHAYKQMLKKAKIEKYQEISFSVPSGNFGDVLAGYYAKEMGLPIKKLIVASNENKVLTDFFKSGKYDRNRDLKITNSPSMDIIVSSNLERLLYHKIKNNAKVSLLQDDLKNKGYFEVEADFSEFFADFATEVQTLSQIKEYYEKYSYLMDTHTAVASFVAENYKKESDAKEEVVVLSTASPYKFSNSILEALGEALSDDEFKNLEKLEEVTGEKIPDRLLDLKEKKIIHKKSIQALQIKDTILEFVGDKDEN